ncbi:MAG: hypothetical protein ACFE9Y_06345 [Promethearchaeota archaeon]
MSELTIALETVGTTKARIKMTTKTCLNLFVFKNLIVKPFSCCFIAFDFKWILRLKSNCTILHEIKR